MGTNIKYHLKKWFVEAVKKLRTITSFALFAHQSQLPQSQEALVTQSDGPSVNSDISLPAVTEVHSTARLDTGNKSEYICRVCRDGTNYRRNKTKGYNDCVCNQFELFGRT